MNIIKKVIRNPKKVVLYSMRFFSRLISDKTFVRVAYFLLIGKRLNLKDPSSYNEKIQWLKLYDRNPSYTLMVDKVEVKDIVGNIIGRNHIIPTLGVWNSFKEIDFNSLPEKFVLKCSHDSGTVIICKNKSEFDKRSAEKLLKRKLKTNYFWTWREWPYKNIKPRILAEKFMVDDSGVELKDYKFFCFDGEPKALFIASERATDTKFDFYDIDFNLLPFLNGHENSNRKFQMPKGFEKMIELSRKLSKGHCHVRVDFYDINGEIYFGEFTLYHWSGLVPFVPEEWDYTFGSWLKLPR